MPPRYTADMIEILEGLEPVRRRPRMYIGEPDRAGMHRLLWAAVGHCLERHFAGALDHLVVQIAGDEAIVAGKRVARPVADAAVGERNHTLARELETLFCGPGRSTADTYETVDELSDFLPIITALSSRLVAEYRLSDGRHAYRTYHRGVLQRAAEAGHAFDAPDLALRFQPDQHIFGGLTFDHDLIVERLRALSFLNPELRIEFHGGAAPHHSSATFHHPDGLAAYLRWLVAGQAVRGEPRVHTYLDGATRVEVALQPTQSTEQHVALSLNSCPCPSGHPLERAAREALRDPGSGHRSDAAVDASAPMKGVVAIISLWLTDAWSAWHSGDASRDDAPGSRAITAAVSNALG